MNFPTKKVAAKNCENLVGSVEVPVGLAGPVLVKNLFKTKTKVSIPLATTEGALVASINRGCKAISHSSGANLYIKKVGMTRAPVFWCQDGRQAQEFVDFLDKNFSAVKKYTQATSNHLQLLSLQTWVRGNLVFARFSFDTGEAMGMNMVSIAISSAWEKLRERSSFPNTVKMIALSSNVCTDKKESAVNRLLGRGYWVQVEVELSPTTLRQILKTNAQDLVKAHQVKNLIGSNVAGSLSQNMQVANAVAAVFIATGQDPAQVVEASQASLVMEERDSEKGGRSIYCSLTLPSLAVGIVGGGTWLPAQRQARELIKSNLTARQLAGVVGVAALAGEISGLAALATNTLAQAHQKLARGVT